MNGFDFTSISTANMDQGRALAWAVKALTMTKMNDPFERAVAELLQAAYERRLDEITANIPGGMGKEIYKPVHTQMTN